MKTVQEREKIISDFVSLKKRCDCSNMRGKKYDSNTAMQSITKEGLEMSKLIMSLECRRESSDEFVPGYSIK